MTGSALTVIQTSTEAREDIDILTSWLPPRAFKDTRAIEAIENITNNSKALVDMRSTLGLEVSNEELIESLRLLTNGEGKISLKIWCALEGMKALPTFQLAIDLGLLQAHDNLVLIEDTMINKVFEGDTLVKYSEFPLYNDTMAGTSYIVKVNLRSPYLGNLRALLSDNKVKNMNGGYMRKATAEKKNGSIAKFLSRLAT
ncbi:MAG: hypothetical protein DRN33_04580 [Thermoplasmata archaeon]|nr:MAG: hypothetical protein DRN33_04580 [Thermoplasmata archaeon]